MNNRKFDLNLLRTLHALLEENNVSQAADRLEISQPSVSSALAKLRQQLEDELFIRRSTGLVPTSYAQSLKDPVRKVIAMIEGEIMHARNFDPATAQRTFRLSMSDLGEAIILPQLYELLEREAPGCRIVSSSHSPRALNEAFMRDELDIAMGYFPDLVANGMHDHPLARIEIGCLVRKAHPLAGATIDLETFESAAQVVISHESRTLDHYEAFLKREGISRDVKIHLANMASLPPVLRAADFIAVAPLDIDRFYGGLAQVGLPFALKPLTVKLYWHHRCHNDSANRWLRDAISRLFLSPFRHDRQKGSEADGTPD